MKAGMKTETSCPVERTAKLLSDTWTMLILRDALAGPKRFCELERSLEGISTRTLANKLRKLVDERMLAKDGDGRYQATEKAKGLRTVESAMRRYGEKYLYRKNPWMISRVRKNCAVPGQSADRERSEQRIGT